MYFSTYGSGQASVDQALTELDEGLLDWIATDGPLDEEYLAPNGRLQVPFFASAILLVYNISSIPSTTPLVLDGATLGAIWSGNITSWNDPAISFLNPNLTLPSASIALAFSPNSVDITELFIEGLSAMNPAFGAMISHAGGSLSNVSGLLGAQIEITAEDRLAFIQKNDNSLTYVDMGIATAIAPGITNSSFLNDGNGVVGANVASVQSAMEDFPNALASGNGTIFNGPGNGSYPLSFLHYLVMNQSRSSLDCYSIGEYLAFFAWTQINVGASNFATSSGYTPLTNMYRKNTINSIGTVLCDGAVGLTESFLIGCGLSASLFGRMAANYEDSTFQLEYFEQTSQLGVSSIIEGSVDFGASIYPVTKQQALMYDIVSLPASVGGLGPVYNIPNILTDTAYPLVLDFQIMSDIYLNYIKMWDDPNITRLNPNITLPHENITIVYEKGSSSPCYLITSALSVLIPEFAATVGPTYVIHFPVMTLEPERTLGVPVDGVVPGMINVPYTLGYWTNYDTLSTRTVKAASMVNTAGYVVAPGPDSFISAMNDFARDTSATVLFLGCVD